MKRLAILIFALFTPAVSAWAIFPFPSPTLRKQVVAPTNVAFANVGTLALNGSGSSVSVPLPASTRTGDLLILTAHGYRASGYFSTPSGWTSIGNASGSGSSWAGYMSYFYQIYAGGGAPTISGSGIATAGIIARFTGANTSTPIGAIGTISVGSASPVTTASITTTANNSLAFLAMTSVNGTAANFATPSGWTAAYAAYNPAFEMSGVTLAKPTSGTATGSTSSTDTGCCGGEIWVALQLEILHP